MPKILHSLLPKSLHFWLPFTSGVSDGGTVGKKTPLQLYIRTFNHKIVPISLTVVSTVLGLIPFLMDGTNEVFWFAFAVGIMSGLLFSLLALVFVMPGWVHN